MQVASILVPLAFALIGALVYALASNGKVVELGRLTFFTGMLVLVFVLAHTSLHVSV